ncbi:MAG: hypothetical protein AB1426_11840 [Bacillota bacterium]
MVFSGRHPVYIVKEGEVTAYRAQCPKDKSLVNWSAKDGGFYCEQCRRVYDLSGREAGGPGELERWPCRVSDGQVFILVRT